MFNTGVQQKKNMAKKQGIMGFRPTAKNAFYLQQIGFIDGRTKGVKKSKATPNFSKFMNDIISYVLETGASSYGHEMPPEQLLYNYWDMKARRASMKYNELDKELENATQMKLKAELLLADRRKTIAEETTLR